MWIKLFWAVLGAYVVLRGFLFVAQYQGSGSRELRDRAEKHFGADDIARGFEYSRRGFGARVASSALDLAVLLVLLWTGLGAGLADRALGWSGGRWPIQAALCVLFLVVALFLLHLPFGYYLGHVLETRFGFSNQSAGGWLVLQTKNLLVGIFFSLVAALLWFGLLRLFPRGWVLVVPAAFTAFQAVVALLMPLVLLPLFYKAEPLPAGPMRDKVAQILQKAGIRVKGIYTIDESRYSRHTNAFFAGLGPTKNIYLFDTLLNDHSEAEVLTVVAHEAGHWREGHIVKGIILGAVGLLAGCLLLQWIYPLLAAAGGAPWRPLTDPGSIPALLLLLLVAGFFTSPIESGVSRRFEREADRAALELTGDAAAFVEAEKRLSRTNRSQLLPHPWVVFWSYSHPPALERIESVLGSAQE